MSRIKPPSFIAVFLTIMVITVLTLAYLYLTSRNPIFAFLVGILGVLVVVGSIYASFSGYNKHLLNRAKAALGMLAIIDKWRTDGNNTAQQQKFLVYLNKFKSSLTMQEELVRFESWIDAYYNIYAEDNGEVILSPYEIAKLWESGWRTIGSFEIMPN